MHEQRSASTLVRNRNSLSANALAKTLFAAEETIGGILLTIFVESSLLFGRYDGRVDFPCQWSSLS